MYFWGCYYHQHTPAPLPGWGTVARAATLYLVPVQNYTWHAPLLGTPSGAQRPAASAAPPQHINIDRRPAAEIHDSVDSVPGASRRWPWRTLLQPAQREIGHSLRAALPTFRRMRRDDASRTSAQAPPRQRDPPPQIPSHHHTTKTPRTRHDAHKQQHNSTLYRRPPVNSKSPRAPSMPTPVHTTTRQRSSVEQARAPRQSRTNLGPQRPSAISRAPPTPQCDTGPPPTGHASTQSRTNLGHDCRPSAICSTPPNNHDATAIIRRSSTSSAIQQDYPRPRQSVGPLQVRSAPTTTRQKSTGSPPTGHAPPQSRTNLGGHTGSPLQICLSVPIPRRDTSTPSTERALHSTAGHKPRPRRPSARCCNAHSRAHACTRKTTRKLLKESCTNRAHLPTPQSGQGFHVAFEKATRPASQGGPYVHPTPRSWVYPHRRPRPRAPRAKVSAPRRRNHATEQMAHTRQGVARASRPAAARHVATV